VEEMEGGSQVGVSSQKLESREAACVGLGVDASCKTFSQTRFCRSNSKIRITGY
jgi:hypothetical protein